MPRSASTTTDAERTRWLRLAAAGGRRAGAQSRLPCVRGRLAASRVSFTGGERRLLHRGRYGMARDPYRPLARALACALLFAAVVAAATAPSAESQARSSENLWEQYPLDPAGHPQRAKGGRPLARTRAARSAPTARRLWQLYPLEAQGRRLRPTSTGANGDEAPSPRADVARERPEPAPSLERAASLRRLLLAALGFGVMGVAFGLLAVRRGAFRRGAGKSGHAAGGPADGSARGSLATSGRGGTEPAARTATPPGTARAASSPSSGATAASAPGQPGARVLFVSGDAAMRDEDGREGSQGSHREREDAPPEGIVRHYLSHDTAPVGFAVPRSAWLAPAFLLSFVALCAAVVPALPSLTSSYADVVSALARVPRRDLLPEGVWLSFRPFLLLLIVLLSLFAAGSLVARLKLLAFSVSLYALSVLALDVVLARAGGSWAPAPFEPVGGVAAGFAGLLAVIVSVLTRYRLPEGVRVKRRVEGSPAVALALMACVASALAATILFSYFRRRYFDDLHLRFIGGLDSELVIFLLSIVGLLFLVSRLNERAKPTEGPGLSVAFLIPAFNEAHSIGDTIRAIDAAAGSYGGFCRLYVADNGSEDGTAEVAATALARCASLEGIVLGCPPPGKSRALNFALSFISEDIVVRIDADTLVPPSLLETVVPWFWDPFVGGVSGLPLPRATTPRWLYPLRTIEVYYGVAFLRVAQAGADAVMVMPGLFAAYRRDALEELGGFAAGINGEDADITMRIGRLGYHIVTDRTVEVHTEVPENLAHLREQRQRWARGLFHMAARNMSTIWMRQGARGLWILPWSLFNAARRSLVIPVLLCAIAVEIMDPAVFALREVSVVAGFIVGLQLVVIAVLLLAHRKFAVLPFVPTYLLFRLFRSYVAFETLFTLPLRASASEHGAARGRPRTLRRARTAAVEREAERASGATAA